MDDEKEGEENTWMVICLDTLETTVVGTDPRHANMNNKNIITTRIVIINIMSKYAQCCYNWWL